MEAPAVARVRSETASQGMEVVAINVLPQYSLQQWESYWRSVGGGDALFAEDTNRSAIAAFKVRAAGTKIIINREGHIVYRYAGTTTYEELRPEVDKAL
ncbi:MAG: TlpA family protein disulfide reductase [Candidatus Binatia bacterium]